MPDPSSRPFLDYPGNQAWLHEMQSYYGPNPNKDAMMPLIDNSAYDMGIADEDSVKKILVALFGGDELAAKMYLQGRDPRGKMKFGGPRGDLDRGKIAANKRGDPVDDADWIIEQDLAPTPTPLPRRPY